MDDFSTQRNFKNARRMPQPMDKINQAQLNSICPLQPHRNLKVTFLRTPKRVLRQPLVPTSQVPPTMTVSSNSKNSGSRSTPLLALVGPGIVAVAGLICMVRTSPFSLSIGERWKRLNQPFVFGGWSKNCVRWWKGKSSLAQLLYFVISYHFLP